MRLVSLFFRLSGWIILIPIACGLTSSALSVLLISDIGRLEAGSEQSLVAIARLIGLAITSLLLQMVGATLLNRNSQEIVRRLTESVISQALDLPLIQFETISAAEMLAILTRDIDALTDTAISIPTICVSAATVLAAAAFGIITAPILTCLWVVIICAGTWIFKQFERISIVKFREARSEHSNLVESFQALVNAAKELRVNQGRRSRLEQKVHTSTAVYRDAMIAAVNHFTLSNSVAQFMYLVLLIAGAGLLNRTHSTTLSGASAFLLLMLFTKTSIESVIGLQPQLSRGKVALDNLERHGFRLNERLRPTVAHHTRSQGAAPHISFSALTFRYDSSPRLDFRVGPISFDVRGGRITFIVGGNGTGKTTLLKLLTGLYQPLTGHITVDGKAVQPGDADDYLSRISVVFSDFHLSHELPQSATLRTADKLNRLLSMLGLDKVVRISNGELSTLELSQGQRKRLALLHVLLEDRPVCFFDEFASDQDPEFKRFFYTSLLPQLRDAGKAILLISHDDQYFYVADQVIQLSPAGLSPILLPESGLMRNET